jgi:ferredoxin
MTFLVTAGMIIAIFTAMFFGWFALVSLREGEKRALLRSAVICLFLISLIVYFLLMPVSLNKFLFAGIVVLTALFFLCLFVSPVPREEIEIVGSQKKCDERDVIFARFDLVEGTERFREYYDNHPELESIDREIRELPDLFASSHMIKGRIPFSLAAAEFDFLEDLLPLVDGRIKEDAVSDSEMDNSRLIKKVVKYLGSDLCGIAPLKQSYVYSHAGRGPDVYGSEIVLDHPYAIVFAVEMDPAMVAVAPRAAVVVETGKQYVEVAKISIILAGFIRRLGYPARAHIAGSNYQAILPPLGWEAGLGELGRSGSLITTKYGLRARLGLVTTSLPLKPDKPKVLGIQNFCEKCRKCALNCPVQAIPHGRKEEENGVLKWVLKREECYRYWRKAGTDCAICMYVCPYSKPANLFHDLIRKITARSSLMQSLSVLGDDVFYGKKPLRKKSRF